jgi:hypothetical protein
MKKRLAGGGLMFSLLMIGCGEAPDVDGDVATIAGAISEPSCKEADADHTDAGGVVPAYISPTTYDNPDCNKAVIVDIPSYSSLYWGSGDIDGQTAIWWNGSVPGTQSACENLWLAAYLYRWSSTNQVWNEPLVREDRGHWIPLAGGFFCSPPFVAFHSTQSPDLIVGRAYRLAITARTQATSAAPTRSVRVESLRPHTVP